MTHTGRMTFPIRPGTARRLSIRRPHWVAGAIITQAMADHLDGPRDGRVITAEQVRQRQRRNR